MLLGVANKAEDYDRQDAQALQALAYAIWRRVVAPPGMRSSCACPQRWSKACTSGHHRREGQRCTSTGPSAKSAATARRKFWGRTPDAAVRSLTPRSIYEEMWRRLPQGQPRQGELRQPAQERPYLHRNRFPYPIRDLPARETHYVAHKEDITVQREAEERIQALSNFSGHADRPAQQEVLRRAAGPGHREGRSASHGRLSMLWFDLDNFVDQRVARPHGRRRAAGGGRPTACALAWGPRTRWPAIRGRLRGHRAAGRPGGPASASMAQEALRFLQTAISVQGHPKSRSAHRRASPCIPTMPGRPAPGPAAELAMYRVKEDGRNGLRFAPEMQAQYAARSWSWRRA